MQIIDVFSVTLLIRDKEYQIFVIFYEEDIVDHQCIINATDVEKIRDEILKERVKIKEDLIREN